MLLQSHEKKGIRLLPALPDSWSSGSVKGLIARNNIIINMKWDNNEIKQVSLKTNSDKSVAVIYKNKIFNFNLKKNEVFVHKF